MASDWTSVVQAISSILSVFVAGISACFVVLALQQASKTLRMQRVSTDISSVLVIWQRLDEHWARFLSTDADQRLFEFGQLISYYEMSCQLFRDRVFSTKASSTLYQHLREILPVMQNNSSFDILFIELKSKPETFENIMWMCDQPNP